MVRGFLVTSPLHEGDLCRDALTTADRTKRRADPPSTCRASPWDSVSLVSTNVKTPLHERQAVPVSATRRRCSPNPIFVWKHGAARLECGMWMKHLARTAAEARNERVKLRKASLVNTWRSFPVSPRLSKCTCHGGSDCRMWVRDSQY